VILKQILLATWRGVITNLKAKKHNANVVSKAADPFIPGTKRSGATGRCFWCVWLPENMIEEAP